MRLRLLLFFSAPSKDSSATNGGAKSGSNTATNGTKKPGDAEGGEADCITLSDDDEEFTPSNPPPLPGRLTTTNSYPQLIFKTREPRGALAHHFLDQWKVKCFAANAQSIIASVIFDGVLGLLGLEPLT